MMTVTSETQYLDQFNCEADNAMEASTFLVYANSVGNWLSSHISFHAGLRDEESSSSLAGTQKVQFHFESSGEACNIRMLTD